MNLHPILSPEATATDLYGKACRRSLGVSQRASTNLLQLMYLRAIPKEMPLLPAEVANLRPVLFVHLFHFLQLLGLYPALLLPFL